MSQGASIDSPRRSPILWQNKDFYNSVLAFSEMERVFDICHGCRRCFNLCAAFPSMFDAIDESTSGEISGLQEQDYWKVVNHCYLCDMCFMSKCPYVPPHPFNVDFPSLMLRLKAIQYKTTQRSLRDRLLSQPQRLGRLMSVPMLAVVSSFLSRVKSLRGLLDKVLGISRNAVLPHFYYRTLKRRVGKKARRSTGGRKVALFSTCYGNHNAPGLGEDLIAVFAHNNVSVELVQKEECCAMPRWEVGDIESVVASMNVNLPILLDYIERGYDIVVLMPSCGFLLKEIWPLIHHDVGLQQLRAHIVDPFEYLLRLHKSSELKTDFKRSLASIIAHTPCHVRAQNMGNKTKELLMLIPGTTVHVIDRCSGHNGSYAMKSEFHQSAKTICKPITAQIHNTPAEGHCSDCPLAAGHIGAEAGVSLEHPLQLLRRAYDI